MLVYKNISKVTKTFHGVTFRPGEIKEVSGYINSKYFVRYPSMPKEPPKSVEKPKKVVTKAQPKPKDEPVKEVKQPEVAEETSNVEQGGILNGSDSNQ